ncbi:hypothetical protein ABZ342_27245 [Amycolatopsis sp. NPDC005961]|uniref:hypothetical protein n=1 Tax=Amycolatopsis sp. NPDC005961 TaxID=3156720 RepID=UPI0034071956
MTTTAETYTRRARDMARVAAYPRTMIPPENNTLRATMTAHPDGRAPAVGETTAVPGLLLTPYTGGTPVRYTGLWCLTHAASGVKVTRPASHAHTREAVVWLQREGVDWDRPAAVCQDDDRIEAAYFALHHLMGDACLEGRPLLYARASWVAAAPRWRIRYRGRISTGTYPTWAAAAAFADYACTVPAGQLHLHPDAEIVRDVTSPGWTLRCASIACSDGSFLADWRDECEAVGRRGDLEDLADDEGWRAHPDGFWTCWECTHNYH